MRNVTIPASAVSWATCTPPVGRVLARLLRSREEVVIMGQNPANPHPDLPQEPQSSLPVVLVG